MALITALKTIRSELSGEIREFRSQLSRLRNAGLNAMGANYHRFGPIFGVHDYDAFVDMARKFFKEAHASTDSAYTIVTHFKDRIAIDYLGEIRGIFTLKGRPLAFFRPDYQALGYESKEQELEVFRSGKTSIF